MPPHEDWPSELVPPHGDILHGNPDKENPINQAVIMNGIIEPQICQLGCGLIADSLNDVLVEPKTGFKFPMVLCCDIYEEQNLGAKTQVLAGVGVKSLNILMLKSINLYAFAFYIEPNGLKVQLGGTYSGISPTVLKHKSCFYEDLLRGNLDMTIRLVVHYKGLKMGMVRSAFDTSLKNRLKKISGTEDDKGLQIFNSYFSENLSLSRGSIIDFQWLPGGQLRTEIDGRLIGTIDSHNLCRAFFDLYIGDPPVSLLAKQEIGEKLGHMLRRS